MSTRIRSVILNLLLPALFLLLVSSPAVAAGGESWNVKFRYTATLNQSGPQGNVTARTTAEGSTSLTADPSGAFAGKGNISVSETVTGPGVNTTAQGQGTFPVKGKRSGDNLIFWFQKTSIPVKGTTHAAGMQIPYSNTFDVSIVTGGGSGTGPTIERKSGAKTTFTSSVAGFGGKSEFTLTGGQNIAQKKKAPAGTFPKNPDIWTLNLKGDWTYMAQGFGYSCSITGSADFPLPDGDGPVKGEGPLTVNCDNMNVDGKFLLDGKIENDILTFIPRSDLKNASFGTSAGPGSSSFGSGLAVFGDEIVSLKVEKDAQKTESFSFQDVNGNVVWTLTGEKTERWRMIIDGWDTLFFGDNILAGGIRVFWKITVDFEIKDDHYHKGTGKAEIVRIESHSHPQGVYNCSVTPKGERKMYNGTFNVPGKAILSQALLDVPKNIHYFADYHCLMDMQTAKKVMDGVGGFPAEHHLRNAGKDVTMKGHSEIPGGPLLSGVAVTLKDGWTKELGNAESMDYEKITITKRD